MPGSLFGFARAELVDPSILALARLMFFGSSGLVAGLVVGFAVALLVC